MTMTTTVTMIPAADTPHDALPSLRAHLGSDADELLAIAALKYALDIMI